MKTKDFAALIQEGFNGAAYEVAGFTGLVGASALCLYSAVHCLSADVNAEGVGAVLALGCLGARSLSQQWEAIQSAVHFHRVKPKGLKGSGFKSFVTAAKIAFKYRFDFAKGSLGVSCLYFGASVASGLSGDSAFVPAWVGGGAACFLTFPYRAAVSSYRQKQLVLAVNSVAKAEH